MTLEKIFELGHRIAVSQNPQRYVVSWRDHPPWPDGHYYLAEDTVQAVSVKGQVWQEDLEVRLDPQTAEMFHWVPDREHCWCRACAQARRVAHTRLREGGE